MRISGTATVPASVGEVFGYMDVPENQAAITPGLIRSQLVERLDNGGSRVAYTYRLFGLTYRGEMIAREYDRDERIAFEMRGDLQGAITWTFAPTEGGTEVTYTAEYDSNDLAPIAPTLLEPLLVRVNGRQIRHTLEALRERFEE